MTNEMEGLFTFDKMVVFYCVLSLRLLNMFIF